ncbi:hypothetical protein [Rhodoblastus sp.]|uniref:hypothetical protein n=1 Tax=Rhodoblastus sp. TaxID=1962975 RepID=UPI003F9589AC
MGKNNADVGGQVLTFSLSVQEGVVNSGAFFASTPEQAIAILDGGETVFGPLGGVAGITYGTVTLVPLKGFFDFANSPAMDFGRHALATSLCLAVGSCDNPQALGPE